ncbi:hypothetical protein VY88_17365 [Azospirillum thiophilum]|uniref:Uncharacterized protein n=1 Tax=Azospirillum thiophilum TaxID=528244 RepID=A0AAC8W087_9PROT|nr:hypothetical protein [Azospirillum thiophilum]ALG72586.1 hypothetical protein AL072_16150 [Azospirillum thiophilum]KJR64496.1 hypothetical protein VY88_17365 [Azospirillum thiophilum]
MALSKLFVDTGLPRTNRDSRRMPTARAIPLLDLGLLPGGLLADRRAPPADPLLAKGAGP